MGSESPRRIHIIGGPGSGKSTLALQLGTLLGIPVFDLDKIAFEGKDFVERPLADKLRQVHEIAEQATWITEGIFVGWVEDLLRNADTIVWLDSLHWGKAAWRIVFRFFKYALEEVGRQPGHHKFTRFNDYWRNLRQLIGVMFTSNAYYHGGSIIQQMNASRITRAATSAQLTPYLDKVIHCYSSSDIQAFMETLANARPESRDRIQGNQLEAGLEISRAAPLNESEIQG